MALKRPIQPPSRPFDLEAGNTDSPIFTLALTATTTDRDRDRNRRRRGGNVCGACIGPGGRKEESLGGRRRGRDGSMTRI